MFSYPVVGFMLEANVTLQGRTTRYGPPTLKTYYIYKARHIVERTNSYFYFTHRSNLIKMPATVMLCSKQQRLSLPRGLGSALHGSRLCRTRLVVMANAAKDPNAPIQSNPLGAFSSQAGTVTPVPRSEEARKYFRTVGVSDCVSWE